MHGHEGGDKSGVKRRRLSVQRELRQQVGHAVSEIWGKAMEPDDNVLDAREEAAFEESRAPLLEEFAKFKVGTSLSSTVRGFWEQTGTEQWPVLQPGDLEKDEVRNVLKRKFEAEALPPERVVEVVKQWDEAVGIPADIKSCAACGMQDFQKVTFHTFSAMDVLQLTEAEMLWYNTLAAPYRKYASVVSFEGQYYWLHPTLITEDEVPLCSTCAKDCLATEPKRPKQSNQEQCFSRLPTCE